MLGNITYNTLKGYDRKEIKTYPEKSHIPEEWHMEGFVYIAPQEATAAIPTPVLMQQVLAIKGQEEGM